MLLLFQSVSAILLDYGGFQLQYDCKKRSADRFQYTLPSQDGPASRPKGFDLDPQLNRDCQQISTDAYSSRGSFDRGHLVTSGHMDTSRELRLKSHYMTNIVPQVRSFNQGIWQQSEQITLCFRSESAKVFGGVVYSNPSNDYFLSDHKIPTPEYMWRVIVAGKKVFAWYFPNQENLGPLSSYAVTVKEIESQLNDGLGPIPIDESLKSQKMTPPDWKKCQDKTGQDFRRQNLLKQWYDTVQQRRLNRL